MTFHVHPNQYFVSSRYDYTQLKLKNKHLEVLPNKIVDLHDVNVVLGHDNFHLVFPVEYMKGQRNEPCAAETKLGRSIGEPLPKHEKAQIATTFLDSDHDHLADQLKSWWSSESYAMQPAAMYVVDPEKTRRQLSYWEKLQCCQMEDTKLGSSG